MIEARLVVQTAYSTQQAKKVVRYALGSILRRADGGVSRKVAVLGRLDEL